MLWLVGMTFNRIDDFREIVQYSDKYFDGLIYVDHFSQDGTHWLLDKHQQNGRIIQRPYFKQHSHSQNEILFCRHAKNGDWMFLNDSPIRILPKWLESMRNDIKEYKRNGIGGVSFSNMIYLWQYFDNQQFVGSPHHGITGIRGKVITFGEEYKSNYLYNKRDENKNLSYLIHPIVYFYCHNPSNETQCMYSKYGQDVINSEEFERQQFRIYCENVLNLSLDSLDDLIEYMKKLNSKEISVDSYFLNFCDQNFRMTDLFRHKILGQNLVPDIVKNRFNWRLSYYLNTGDIEQKDTGWTGKINILNKKYNYPEE